jgi:PTH1 family peptidyl-tRNA hydrolase
MLAKPQTFMNLSGDAVAPLAGYYKVDAGDMVVVHDDIDIELGRMKVVFGAGHGGHNGVRSIIETIGGNAFYRIRVGVGRPTDGIDAADHVLTSFSGLEREDAANAADAVVVLLRDGLAKAQQTYN